MLSDEIPVGDELRSLVIELHAALKRPTVDPEVVRGLMFRASTLKARVRLGPSNALTRYLAAVQRLIGRAYLPSPSSELAAPIAPAGRHAA